MDKLRQFETSRRGLLRYVATGSAATLAVLLIAPEARAATGHAASSPAVESGVDALDYQGLCAEYRNAIRDFPLPLPDGWSFPPESQWEDPGAGVAWERGNGIAEAFNHWQRGVAMSAREAHERGDDVEADRLLDVLTTGSKSPTGRAVFEDIDDALATRLVAPARGGTGHARGLRSRDFSALMNFVGA